ncbi:class I SAM-dependent methyltransferase [Gimesia maris]|uniref:class I SAM-dependent methyltransferase n=1 Tax=Gimesia maris TaxID=122 RepID=UPI003A93EEEB
MQEFSDPPFTIANLDRYVVRTAILDSLTRHLGQFSGRFLDVGAGNQPYRELLQSKQTQVSEYVPLDLHDNWNYKDADNTWDGVTMPFPDNSFDSAMATEVLEHCPNPEVTLSEVSRVLKPGGFFFFTVPFVWPLHDCPHDEYRYTPWSLERHFANSGFTDVRLFPTGGWDASLAQVLGLWVRRRPMSARKKKWMSILLKPVIRSLLRRDEVIDSFSHRQYLMPGIAGTARAL